MTVKFKVTSEDVKQYFDHINIDTLLHNLDNMEEDEESRC